MLTAVRHPDCREPGYAKSPGLELFKRRAYPLAVLLIGLSSVLQAQQAPPSAYEGQPVVDVNLIARPSVDVETYKPLILQQAGTPFSNEQVQKSIAALQAIGQFSKVDVIVTPEKGGIRVEFIMEPAYYIAMLNFPGALGVFTYPRLLQAVSYQPQEPYEKIRVEKDRTALQDFLTKNGYFEAKVDTETQMDEARKLATINYHVQLNKLARVGTILITGPPAQDAGRLKQALRSIRARLAGAYLKEGQRYDAIRIQAAQRFLRAYLGKQNHLANRVKLDPAQYDPEAKRATLHFEVQEGPTVVVRVVGAHIWKRTLRTLLPVYEENSIDQELIYEGRRNLISYFQGKGFFDVNVTPQLAREDLKLNTLTYAIERGKRHRIQNITLGGNHAFDSDDLADQMVVKKATFLSRGTFSQDLLNKTVNNLTAFYQNAGFPDVKVTPKVVDHEPDIDVTFDIKEGEHTIVDSFQLEGNLTQAISALAPDGLAIQEGQPYSAARANQDRSRIVATYLNMGYLNASFKSTVTPVGGNVHHVSVNYLVDEGPRVRISQVNYLGQKHTKTLVIEREAQLRPESEMSEGKMLEGESRLYNLGVFDWADVAPRRPITDQTAEEVMVRVHEAKRNTLSYGLGFESTPRTGSLSSGVLILPGLPTVGLPKSFTIIQNNVINPQGSLEYSRLNMRGMGETVSLSALVSTLDLKATMSYSQPHFLGTNWDGLWSFFGERTTQNPLFTARLGQASFQIERTLDAAKTRRLLFRYNYQRTLLSNLLIKNFVPLQDQSVILSTLSASFVRDTRDKPLDAHKGVYQTLDFGISPTVMGSTENVARFFGQAAYYRRVRLKPEVVWANNVRLGLVSSFAGSHVPFSGRFFSGGADSLRGFPLNGAGPQSTALLCTKSNDPSTCTAKVPVPTGGRELFIFNSEARFPIPIRTGLGGVVFYDGGNVYDSINLSHFIRDYSNTVGFGLRYQTPVGPIRVDIGHNLNPVPGLKSLQVYITIGQSF
jgi:outer membrane protein insertion porin family